MTGKEVEIKSAMLNVLLSFVLLTLTRVFLILFCSNMLVI